MPDSNDIRHSAAFNMHEGTDGEFKGWRTWTSDPFLNDTGPFWHRVETSGAVRCAFRVQPKHLNGFGNVHGGCLVAFVDYCVFAIANHVLNGPGVTVSLSGEFLGAARDGELIEATGEVTHAGGSLIFVRGELKSRDRRLFTFSGTIKRIKNRT